MRRHPHTVFSSCSSQRDSPCSPAPLTQHLLEEVGRQLETASFQLYSRHWERLEETLPTLAAAVEAFVASTERDVRHAAEVVACCTVRCVRE
jgi:hypothetical protein